MSDHAPTLASIAASDAASLLDVVSGVAVPQGDVVYLDTANANVAKLAKANGTLLESTVAGIALNGVSAAGRPLKIATLDTLFAPGITIGSGVAVYLSPTTPGKMCPVGDLASTNYAVLIGIGKGSNKINLKPVQGGQL